MNRFLNVECNMLVVVDVVVSLREIYPKNRIIKISMLEK